MIAGFKCADDVSAEAAVKIVRERTNARALRLLQIEHLRTRLYTSKTNGKPERFRSDQPARMGLRPSLPNLRPSRPRTAALGPPV
jgi:hypothetical protein